MRRLVENRWFALTDLLLVIMSAAAWMLIPRYGIGFSLIAFLPWVLRFLAGHPPFQSTPFDWPIAIFLVTAWVGYWAAYDQSAAFIKFWLLVSAIWLYYALSAQPKQNLIVLSFLSFCFALALSIYFCITYDFANNGGGFAGWWVNSRPQVEWPAIHAGYVSGLVVISSVLGFYWVWDTGKKFLSSMPVAPLLFLISGIGLVALVFASTLSRAIELISLGVGAVGFLTLWRVSTLFPTNVRLRAWFPVLVLVYLFVLITLAYFGLAGETAGLTDGSYGINSRVEVFERSTSLLADYPFTGAGLASIPGLYSQYILVIPYFYFTNSYNLFLDVAIEQGVIAAFILGIIYLGSVIMVSRAIANGRSSELQLMRWLVLLVLIVTIVHGFFYDYLYNGNGTALLFYPLGMAMIGAVKRSSSISQTIQQPRVVFASYRVIIVPLLVVIAVVAFNRNKIMSLWYANLGAVQMSQAELNDFPTGEWQTSAILPRLELAETTLQTALQFEPRNQTANYRLGLISMLRQDFETAAANLETAHQQAPGHRGVIKSLGYCYVWLGEMDKAGQLLEQIPEAQHEMKVYIWWWGTQGRPDLAERATQMTAYFGATSQ